MPVHGAAILSEYVRREALNAVDKQCNIYFVAWFRRSFLTEQSA